MVAQVDARLALAVADAAMPSPSLQAVVSQARWSGLELASSA